MSSLSISHPLPTHFHHNNQLTLPKHSQNHLLHPPSSARHQRHLPAPSQWCSTRMQNRLNRVYTVSCGFCHIIMPLYTAAVDMENKINSISQHDYVQLQPVASHDVPPPQPQLESQDSLFAHLKSVGLCLVFIFQIMVLS